MEISLKRNHGYYLVFKAENVNVEEDIEQRIYSKTEDGKTDFKTPPKRDIQDAALIQITSLLDDMMYYREREFDSEDLIRRLFDKLPEEVRQELVQDLYKEYSEE